MDYDLNDARKGLAKADKTLNKGITGWLTRTFMGKNFTGTMNETLEMGNSQIDMVEQRNVVMMSGKRGTAVVLAVGDTGRMINFDPVVKLSLQVTPEVGPAFPVETETVVSKIAVPRVGDMITVKYDAANRNSIAVM